MKKRMEKFVHKACPCVVVDSQILAFRHPFAGFQIPKGTVEAGENVEAAVLRELEEESGIDTAKIVDKVCELDWYIAPGTTTFKQGEHQRWHLYLVDPGKILPASWAYIATGSEAEEGLTFSYFWQSLTRIPEDFHPVYHEVMGRVYGFLGASSF